MKTKLIRNLKEGDIIQCTDACHYPSRVHRVTITRVQESRRSLYGRRTWEAYFVPHIFPNWCNVWGYSDDRIEVYN